ncbi:GxxExxY protein [Gemmatirosa kalamazoonensis]|uniref:GxxExxY protein n=1 Tax=Gemmatirosa kalamazoonensis TaxID=861299 RepID=W0RMY5_9BACT|nr:GxxExxY protein [Gemmatirosa kalamazoonensis]AHG91842.1 GxxExxY protein [Gemmatirosa kalamazoonensis]
MSHDESLRDPLTHGVIGAFYDVYNTLAYGLSESLYARALEIELRQRGHQIAREVCFTVRYKGIEIGTQRIDMVVDGCIVVETKSTIDLHRGAPRQVLGYLRASGIPVGLLLHFGPEPSVRRITLDGWRGRVRDEVSTHGDPAAIDEISG